MMENGWKFLFMLHLVLVLLCSSLVAAAEQAPSLLPAGLVMQDGFKPGFGADIGLVQRTSDRVALVHAQDMVGYWARLNLPVFMKDAIITPADGRAILLFQDESTVAISADTKLVINRSIFDPDKKERSSFLGMTIGKARFFVKKLPGFVHSEFKVKTKTLVAGVRGSDFVITVYPDDTTVVDTLDEETKMDVVIFEREGVPQASRQLSGLSRVQVNEGKYFSPIEKISPEEAQQLKNEMPLPQGETGTTTPVNEAEAKETKGAIGQTPTTATGQLPATGTAAPLLNVQQETVLVSGDELVDPIPPVNIVEPTPAPEIIEQTEFTAMDQEAANQQEEIQQEVAEDQTVEISPLPDFPTLPQQ